MISDPASASHSTSSDSTPSAAVAPEEWSKLHPLSIAITGVRYLRGLIAPLVIVIISQGFSGGREAAFFTFLLPLVVAVIAMVASVARWMLFRYAVTDRELVIRSGVISRQERVVPFARIQSVDLEEPPLERILRLIRVRVETAASGSDEGKIEFQSLSRDQAQHLREHLILARQQAIAPTPNGVEVSRAADAGITTMPTTSEGELLRKLSTRDLLLAGATSGRIGPAAAIVGVAVQFGTDYVPDSWWDRVPWEGAASANLQIIAAAVAIVGVFAWVLSIASTVLTHAGFEVRRSDDQIVIQHGLLERRRRTIPIRRIQAVVVVEGLFRQPFGYGELRFESAGQANGSSGESGVIFPFLPVAEIEDLIARSCPEFSAYVAASQIRPLPIRARRRYVVPPTLWTIAFAIAVNLVFVRWFDGPRWWTLIVFALVPIVAITGWFQYRAAGWHVSSEHLLLRWRTLTARSTMVTRRQRLQHRSLTANPFQRRANLVTFHVAVASGGSGGRFGLAHIEARDGEFLLSELRPRSRRSPDRD